MDAEWAVIEGLLPSARDRGTAPAAIIGTF